MMNDALVSPLKLFLGFRACFIIYNQCEDLNYLLIKINMSNMTKIMGEQQEINNDDYKLLPNDS